MTSFFHKNSNEHVTTKNRQGTTSSLTSMVSTSPMMTCMGLFPKMVKNTPQWQSTVTIFSKYAIPGNDFKIKLFKGIHVVVSKHCNTIGKPFFIAKKVTKFVKVALQ
jgi:hypothetical protein